LNHKVVITLLIILFSFQLLLTHEVIIDSTQASAKKISPFLVAAGVSLLITQSYNIDIGFRHNNNDYYLRYRRSNGVTVSKEIQFRVTNFMNEERTGGFIGLFAGYAKERKRKANLISGWTLFDYSFGDYEDKFMAGIEFGIAPISGIKIGADLGYMPGVFNFNVNIAIN